jgi:hypothetical protein
VRITNGSSMKERERGPRDGWRDPVAVTVRNKGTVTVAQWIGVGITLVLLVALGCYIAGWVGHTAYAQEYAAQYRASRAVTPTEPTTPGEAPQWAFSIVPVPVVVTVYYVIPTQLSHLSNDVVIHTHSPSLAQPLACLTARSTALGEPVKQRP